VKCRFTESAEDDLEAIADWIARDNKPRALSFVLELKAACMTIADFPEAWPLVLRYQAQGIRRKVHGNYLIFFTLTKSEVTIIHILHGAREYESLLFPEPTDLT
jgi:toxin ParE1/3/4